MFEQFLFNTIKNNFTVSGYTLAFGFGRVPSTTKQPYIIQYSLDTDGDAQFLCNEDDFTDGQAFIQWNIYTDNPEKGFYLKTELMKYVASLDKVTLGGATYIINQNTHSSSPSGVDENTGLFVEIVARDITYNKV